MAKLFSFEEQDLDQAGTDVELDSSAEEGASAQVAQDMAEDHAEIAQLDTGVQEGTDAAGQLGQVQAGVQAAVDSGEGLTEQSAEGYRLALESIAMMVGAPKKTVYALYSTENFASTSSRMANTRISLEGVGDFLKDLWERIKAAIKSVITKVKAFYAKHLSGLGRVTKALESIKKKIGETKGTVKETRVKISSALASAFPVSGSLSHTNVTKFITTHQTDTTKITSTKFSEVIAAMKAIEALDVSSLKETVLSANLKKLTDALNSASTNDTPFVGGKYIKNDSADQGGEYTVDFKYETTTLQTESDAVLAVASKAELSSIVTATVKLISDTKGFGKAVEVFEKDFSAEAKKIDGKLTAAESASGAVPADLKIIGDNINKIGKISSMAVTRSTAVTSFNVKAAFAVVSYVKFNLALYK